MRVASCAFVLLLLFLVDPFVVGARRAKKKAKATFRDPNEAIGAATAAKKAGDVDGAYLLRPVHSDSHLPLILKFDQETRWPRQVHDPGPGD